ncbi:MAG: MarR family transcriptional regulator [Ramlibacter sp.]|nr:MarR family transcriptional regulator [Ramlibacter sp.]MBX3657306.1 MarR family transcriptional regulator [Ramlibacter sp.]MCW5649262.1 MarR family transcriptional regulator [Ramlibacter sp.]
MSADARLMRPQSLDDLLLYRTSRLLGVAGSLVIRLCEGRFGITRREWRVMALLARNEGLLSSQLAERAQLDRARTSKAVSSLVAKQLVSREPRPSDRREARLALTPAGRELYETMFPVVVDINRELLEAVSADEVAQLDRILDALHQRAEAMVAQSTAWPRADRRRGGRSPREME